MWQEVLEKIRRLKALDQQCQAFGAENHRYRLLPCASNAEIEEVEDRLGTVIPYALRAFYRDIGDGIVGPDYGLVPVAELGGYSPDKPYTEVGVLRAMAKEGYSSDSEEDYFEVDHKILTGLISIIDQGCGHEVCLITAQPKAGSVVYVSVDGYVVETDKTLIDRYHQWLDREIEQFETVKALMETEASFQQIQSEIAAQFQMPHAGDLIASIANVAKPPALFGAGYYKVYHGASEYPWYENVLQEWRNTHHSKPA